METVNQVAFAYDSLDEAFPPCDPGVEPLGSRVLIQIRTPKTVTKGGIHLLDETRETEHWNTQVAKVVAIGSLAFCNRNTREQWPEGSWCKVGDYVRVPKYGGDRWSMTIGRGEAAEEVFFAIFNDLDLIGKITGDPTNIKAYI